MTKGQKELWKMRFRELRLYLACFALCATVMWLANIILGWAMHPVLLLLRAGIVGFAVYVAYLFWSNHHGEKKMDRGEGRRAVPLKKFLSDPGALIAPHHANSTEALHQWLLAFERTDESKAVWVIPHEDQPSALHVFLIAAKLSDAERKELRAFHADGISTLAPSKVKRLLPELPDIAADQKVYEVLWD